MQLVSRSRSRPLSELTRQVTSPTKNGHAPPPIESRKNSQSVNHDYVRAWWDFPRWLKLSRRLHSWWCPSVNSFKFQPCDHTPPRAQRLRFLLECRRSRKVTATDPQSAEFIVGTTTVSNRLRSPNFRPWLTGTHWANAFALVCLCWVLEFHLSPASTNAPDCPYQSSHLNRISDSSIKSCITLFHAERYKRKPAWSKSIYSK